MGGGGHILKRRFKLQSRPPHFSRHPCARYRRFRRCPDIVCAPLTGQAVVPPNASRSHAAGGIGTGAVRGGLGEVRREAHPSSIPKPQRRSTVVPFMQLALSASSAVRPAAPPLQQRSPSPAARLASTRTTQLALLQSAPSTVICSRSACCLKLMHANAPSRCSHPHGPSIPAPAGRAAPAQAVESSILTPTVSAPQRRRKSAGCARKADPRHA